MKTINFCALAMVVACGGSGDTDIDGGADTGLANDGNTTNDGTATNPDGGTQDSGSVGDSSAPDGSTFNVQNVLGLVIWLKGDLGSSVVTQTPDGGGTPTITQWTDQTTHHNDAKGVPNLARNPTVKANAINALSAVHFDKTGVSATVGNMLNITNNADNSLQWGTGDFYVAIVGDFDNDPADGPSDGVGNFFSKTAQAVTSLAGTAFYGNIPAPNNGTPTAGLTFLTAASPGDLITTSTAYNNSAPHLFAIRRQSGKMDLFVDDTSVASTTPQSPVDQDNASAVRIGADGDATLLRLDGDIGEIIAVEGVLAASDETGIESYLKTKWATP